MDDLSYGNWVRRRRRALDLTQTELAQRVGCARTTIEKIEMDARRPSKVMAERLADALELAPELRPSFLSSARSGMWAGDDAVPFQPPDPPVAESARFAGADSAPVTPWPHLPVPATSFIGRSHEVAEICVRLGHAGVRLLTLIGPGGIGKTRLALQVASDLRDDFAGRIAFVPLAAVRDPALVLPTIALMLGIRETSGETMKKTLASTLRTGPSLLILDNFEHLLRAGPDVAALLAAAPELQVLVTSRVVLHLTGEHQFAVPPLALPDARIVQVDDHAVQVEACALFITRARAAQHDFVVTPANVPAIAAICTRLDGLPLAIELAAARSKVLPPADLLRRLAPRLPLLTGGSRDLPARQQTIRGTIDWSYDLLALPEQVLFRRLAVFAGGCTLAAAEAVCGASAGAPHGQRGSEPAALMPTVVDGLQALLDHSLIQYTECLLPDAAPERRFTMLELVHEYAYEHLVAHDEVSTLQRRHAEHYLGLAEEGARETPGGPGHLRWITRLEREQDNVRAALQWALDQREAALAMRFAAALAPFWQRRDDIAEGTRWLNAALSIGAHDPTVDPALHAEALFALTTVVSWGGRRRAGHPGRLSTGPRPPGCAVRRQSGALWGPGR